MDFHVLVEWEKGWFKTGCLLYKYVGMSIKIQSTCVVLQHNGPQAITLAMIVTIPCTPAIKICKPFSA